MTESRIFAGVACSQRAPQRPSGNADALDLIRRDTGLCGGQSSRFGSRMVRVGAGRQLDGQMRGDVPGVPQAVGHGCAVARAEGLEATPHRGEAARQSVRPRYPDGDTP